MSQTIEVQVIHDNQGLFSSHLFGKIFTKKQMPLHALILHGKYSGKSYLSILDILNIILRKTHNNQHEIHKLSCSNGNFNC